ncbi:hypothetical protein [Micromonospora inositola]|uniref:Uncharacterized protein n=1 Tax=Micromonospora inositola TaxID=47865 RepID=A0A1C5K576_9ACTN|nr:hypothetical protein [Micromonospora inositola]SCG77933.1 hypothetical protein GA0070613_6411 [Micromonospora inositola]
MSSYGVMKHLRQWYADRDTTGWLPTATAQDLLAVCDHLSEEEARALVDRRVDVLYEQGVHPMSLIQMSRLFGFDIAQRWQELRPGAGAAGEGPASASGTVATATPSAG